MMSFSWSIFTVVLFVTIDVGFGLRCLSCKGTLEPWLCRIVKTCKNNENVCGLRSYRGTGGEIIYDTFCSTETMCGFGNSSICDHCCRGDMCNAAGCGSSGYPPNHNRICYNCNQVTDLSECADIAFCNQGHLCAVYEESVLGRHFYSSKCLPAYACGQETAIFGKRQSSETLCGPCCDVDLCNDRCHDVKPVNGISTTSHTVTELDINMEYLLMYPYSNTDTIYLLISANSPGYLDVEVPHISMNKTIPLTTGRTNLTFDFQMMMGYPREGVENKGIYLKSSVPVTVFVIIDWTREKTDDETPLEHTEGFMVLPVEKLGREYRVIRGDDGDSEELISIASLYDNTEVHVKFQTSSRNITFNGSHYQSGDIYTVMLQRLDTLCLYHANITGTTIRSDKPIAVIGGSDGLGITRGINPAIEFLPPVSKLGTTFIIPPFPETPVYYIRLLLATDGDDAVVDVTNATGTHQYRLSYTDVRTEITIDSGPSFITSTRPIYVTVKTYTNSSIPSTLVSIPSVSNYRNVYTIPNPNSITPHDFDQHAVVVIPLSRQSGLMVNNIRVHSTADTNPNLQVYSATYAFLTIPIDDPHSVISHVDSSVKFGAFIFGKSQWKQENGYSRYAFPAGFQ